MKYIVFSLAIFASMNSISLADFPWVTIIDREGSDGGHLTVQLDSTVAYEYTVYSAPQFGGTGYIADLEPGNVFIEWDEDPGHGNTQLFTFSGTYNDETPDFLQVAGTGTTNWTVHTVTGSGTLIKTNDCCNEHDAVHLSFSPLALTKTDDVNNGACIVPGDKVTYTMCYTYPMEPNLSDINDANIIDYLPISLEYISSDPPAYYYSQSRTINWPIGTIRPGDTNCVTLTVKVKDCIADRAEITNLCEIRSNSSIVKNTSEHTPLCIASNSRPASGETGIFYIGQSPDINLTWYPGYLSADVNGHDIYFGTDFSEVNIATTSSPQYKGRQSITSYPAGGLEIGKTYYWRVDEVNDPCFWHGTVWNFDTGLLIDDFEQYETTEEMLSVWLEAVPPNACWNSGTGSGTLTLIFEASNKYMQFAYDKSGGASGLYFSEVMVEYNPNGADWTQDSLAGQKKRTLVIPFKGMLGNSTDPIYDRMYIAIEDTDGDVNTTLHPDPNAQAATSWQDWVIPLEDLNSPDVNLDAVRYFSIGFGERCASDYYGGGDGNVMFDNIRLQPPCIQKFGFFADLTGDCTVDLYDMTVLSQQWLVCGICGLKADISPVVEDGLVDFRDFAVLASQWLEETP